MELAGAGKNRLDLRVGGRTTTINTIVRPGMYEGTRGRKKVTLRPRNTVKNEDEGGHPNIRNGKTNYFIFPSKSSEDASWLKGKGFKALVVVRFQRDGKKFESVDLELKPHTH